MGGKCIIIIDDFDFSCIFEIINNKVGKCIIEILLLEQPAALYNVGRERFNFWSLVSLSLIKNFSEVRGDDVMQPFI